MLSPISSVSTQFPSTQPLPQQAPPPKTATPQDTVHVSQAALAATGGDADHDGDSR